MMLLHCSNCGLVFREDDAEIEECLLGEAWGRPIYERNLLCPKCGETAGEYDGDEEPERVTSSLDDFANMFNPGRER